MRTQEAEQLATGVAMAIVVVFVALLASLAGCASAPAAPVIPTEVRVPVPVACVGERPKAPARLSNAQLKALDDYRLVLTLALERELLEVYVAQLEAALAGCWMPSQGGT